MARRQYHFQAHTENRTYRYRCDIANEHVQQDDEEETESSSFAPSGLPVHLGERKQAAAVDHCI